MTTNGVLEALLGKVRGAVLALLFSHPDEAYYLRQAVRETGLGHGAVQRELALLLRLGLVTRERRGREVFYQARQASPLFPELRGLIIKTAGLTDALREALTGVKGISLAFIFGSMAKGTFDSKSDVDVLIVGDASFADISAALLPAQQRLGREIIPTVYSREEFHEKRQQRHNFLMQVLEGPKIGLIGGLDDLVEFLALQ